MEINILSVITVVLLSMFKCVAGILAGLSFQLPIGITIILNIIGMALTVIIISYAGPFIKLNILERWFPVKKLFTKKNRRIISIWNKYGLLGVSFLTPILFMPIGGTLIAISFGVKPLKIITFMLFSILFWSPILTFSFYQIKEAVL